jgi:hypothetical protein
VAADAKVKRMPEPADIAALSGFLEAAWQCRSWSAASPVFAPKQMDRIAKTVEVYLDQFVDGA